MKRSAKELCAMLITKGLKTLTDDEEEVVVDYLDDLGIETTLDDTPKDLCVKLLDNVMQKDIGKKIPISAFANSIIDKEKKSAVEKNIIKEQRDQKNKRENKEKELKNKINNLPGCVQDANNIFKKTLYNFIVRDDIGISELPNKNLQYNAEVSINSDLYNKVFLDISTPVLEITTNLGNKGYTKITSLHDESPDIIYISPLVASILKINGLGSGNVKLCVDIPRISKVDFTYYGNNEKLQTILKNLTVTLPLVINAFSYLSLGMILKTIVDDNEVNVRVDKLYDENNDLIFVGIIAPGESDIPFDIVADE